MTWQEKLQQSEAEYEKVINTLLSQLNDPNSDALASFYAFQETAVTHKAILREAAQNAHTEVSEHYLSLAEDLENGEHFFLTTLLGYRSRHFPQA